MNKEAVQKILDDLEAEIRTEYQAEPTDEMRLMAAGGIGAIRVIREDILRIEDD